MKLTLLPLLLASLIIASAAQSPAENNQDIVPVEGSATPPFARVGLAIVHITNAQQDGSIDVGTWTSAQPEEDEATRPRHHRHACGLGILRGKLIMLSNWLRARVGLPPVAAYHHRHHHHHHHHHHGPHHPPHHPHHPHHPPHHPQPPPPHHPPHHPPPPKEPNEPGKPEEITQLENGAWVMSADGQWYQWLPHSFAGRLHKALMTLGPWEGRAMAFVIGCGIGSLIRMVYVLAVIAYRATCASRRREGGVLYSTVPDEDHYVTGDEQPVPKDLPPSYVDRKDVQVAESKN